MKSFYQHLEEIHSQFRLDKPEKSQKKLKLKKKTSLVKKKIGKICDIKIFSINQ